MALSAYTYLWEFLVQAEHVGEFERVYGPDGPWVALFGEAAGYLGTLLLRDRSNPLRFITVDRWESADAHRAFRAAFAREYAALDARCAHLTVQEVALGSFDEATVPESAEP
jgi:heme-degrading monooxygenase HmoA